jgi:hypothetical protein
MIVLVYGVLAYFVPKLTVFAGTDASVFLTIASAYRAVFPNRQAMALVIPGRERFFWNLSF